MNQLRPLLVGTAAAVIVTAAAVVPAQATDGDPVGCTVQSTSPDTVSIGIEPQQVQFAVHTDCGDAPAVRWQLTSDQHPGSAASWLMLRNWDRPGGEKYTYLESPQGYVTIDPVTGGLHPGNAMAGEHPLSSSVFVDANGDGVPGFQTEPVTYGSTVFRLRRATTFGDSFRATPLPTSRPPGQSPLKALRQHRRTVHPALKTQRRQGIRFTGALLRANWDTDAYEPLDTWLTLQFQRSGSPDWEDVTQVRNDGTATVTVPARHTGTWRYHYAGDDISGSTNSAGVFVVVDVPPETTD